MKPLPAIMVAPNGARLTQSDHATVPVTIDQIVAATTECVAAGADGLHAHVRDQDQQHVLDAGLYRELLSELSRTLPDLYVQITTEAVGRYTPQEQMKLVADVAPKAVSVAIREITDGTALPDLRRFYHGMAEAGIAAQHILYSVEDIDHLADLNRQGILADHPVQALLVLGRYTANQTSAPEDLDAPRDRLLTLFPDADWAVCAFGSRESECLAAAVETGGKVRIGFENNTRHPDGTLACNNAERITKFLNYCPQASGIKQ